MKPLTSIVDELKKLEGFDGFALFNEDLKLIEATIDERFLNDNSAFSIRNILNANIQLLGESENTILMTEGAAWYLSKIGQKYLAILAGLKNPVDIPDLIKLGVRIKNEVLM